MIKIIDNFLSEEEFCIIKEFVYDKDLQWKHGKMLPSEIIVCEEKENYQDCYILYSNGNYNPRELSIIMPVLKKLQAEVLLKAKINRTTSRNKRMLVGWHTDCTKDHWAYKEGKVPKTAIFYINTNDGSTIIDDQNVNCVENRIVIFDSEIKHSGITCNKSENKILININYY